jgi:hypothetical protein
MKTEKVLYLAGAGAIAGGLAFVASRLTLREGIRQAIVTSATYEQARLVADAAGLFGVNLGLPTADAMARAMVPIFSTASPYEAAEDIQTYGRQSRFWPADFKDSSLPYAVEMALIAVAVAVAREDSKIVAQISQIAEA